MSVTRDYTINDFALIDVMVPNEINEASSSFGGDGGNELLQGSLSRTSGVSGRSATVKAGEDIRPALESLKSAGGGTLFLLAGTHRPTYDIVGSSKINIVGEGIDQTIVDFGGGSYSLKYLGTVTTNLTAFSIKDLTVKNSSASAGVYLDYCTRFVIERVSSNDNTNKGFIVDRTFEYSFSYVEVNDNGDTGIQLQETSGIHKYGYFTFLTGGNNAGDGIEIGSGVTGITLLAPTLNDNDNNGIEILGGDVVVIADRGAGNGSIAGQNFEIGTAATSVVVLGVTSKNSTKYEDKEAVVSGGIYGGFATKREISSFSNYTGSTLNPGEVVTLGFSESTAYGKEITTTTTAGDDMVIGMVTESISHTSSGHVLLNGTTALLKVNGTTAIAVGDFLGTYTSAGIAMKAAAGDMAFAIALEAYSTADSSGVIDALIISPRKI